VKHKNYKALHYSIFSSLLPLPPFQYLLREHYLLMMTKVVFVTPIFHVKLRKKN